MMESIRSSAADSQRLFEPLKRLALHLAQQLVRGELSLSGDAVNRLVDQCLLEIDQSAGRELVLSLNPDDVERWRRRAPIALESVTLRPDPGLSIGSVRVSAGESVIEDLIEHRLQRHLVEREVRLRRLRQRSAGRKIDLRRRDVAGLVLGARCRGDRDQRQAEEDESDFRLLIVEFGFELEKLRFEIRDSRLEI